MSASEPTENEIKIAVENAGEICNLLARKGFAVVTLRVFEANVVYDTPEASLRAQGCLLRLRTTTGCILTYKGPASVGQHKSRTEIETGISDAINASRILNYLGFQECFRYEKYRTEFARSGEPGKVMVDETPIGSFLELEGPPDWIDATALELGFSTAQYVTASYGSLYRRYCEAHRLTPANMVFDGTNHESNSRSKYLQG